ncbi:MAG: hypothetical protein FJ137_20595 [Deltaproteobacteria bacterium]|nr:hypothetical protein [Deltaproteobacteria bacterium]
MSPLSSCHPLCFLRSTVAVAALVSAVACEDASYTTLTDPPLVNIAGDVVDCGRLPVGFSVRRTLRVLNAGDETLTVSARIEDATVFGLTQAYAEITANADFELPIDFAPTTTGVVQGRLILTTNDPRRAELVVTVTGEGVADRVCGACTTPPEGFCTADANLVRYDETGTCVDGACQYNAVLVPCSDGCNVTDVVCVGGEAPGTPPDAGAPPDETDAGTPPDEPDAGTPPDEPDAGTPPDATDGEACPPPPAPPATATATCPGEQLLDVAGAYTLAAPAGCTSVLVEAWGGGGGGGGGVQQGADGLRGGNGGGGGFATRTLNVGAGDTLAVVVGQGGAGGGCAPAAPGGVPGGGNGGLARGDGEGGGGGGGGGLTRVDLEGQVVVVAAGGGGGAAHGWGSFFVAGHGGAGGGAEGARGVDLGTTQPGLCVDAVATGGGGGSVTRGGAGGSGLFSGSSGGAFTGGTGGNYSGDVGDPGSGGGGGGGVFGGGGGGSTWTCNASGAGGGGGASLGATTTAGSGAVAGEAARAAGAGVGGSGGFVAGSVESGAAGAAGRVRLTWRP